MKNLKADLNKAVLWEYEKATRIKTLVANQNTTHSKLTNEFWQNWYNDVFNIDTANEFGLSIWARILDVNVTLSFDAQPDKLAFGVGRNRRNFSNPSNFGARDGSTVGLTTEQIRLIIRSRYFSLTQRPTVTNINEFLKKYFWRGDSTVYVADPLDMSFAIYIFTYRPSGDLAFILDNADVLPRPSAVGTTYRVISRQSFGVSRNRRNFAQPSNFGVIQ